MSTSSVTLARTGFRPHIEQYGCRLVSVTRAHDPGNVFRLNQNIAPG